MKVEIDGVLYVPATEAQPSARQLMRVLAELWWGLIKDDAELDRLLNDGAYQVIVTDSEPPGQGATFEEVMRLLALSTEESSGG